ncbi:hypothetical protein QAD02_010419 [Eretmocerus hayati]|uniref:Uncharacterized protein n=1 Tax=Eretmocerus hayati TaxID=131215 RepID=A0ACC2NTU0_9HYME|nr:hypothetical protein QAD02_010419 [Eretmocerus hayati]
MPESNANAQKSVRYNGGANGRILSQVKIDKLESDREFVIKTYETQKTNRFSEDAEGSFVVPLFDARDKRNLGRYYIMEFGVALFRANVDLVDLNHAGPNKYAVKFSNYKQANDFVETGINRANKDWRAFIIDSSLYEVGSIFNISDILTVDEILKGPDK